MNKCLSSFRGLRLRHFAVVLALPFAVGLPFLWAQYALFGPSGRVLSLLTSHFRLSADALTVSMMAAWCLLFSAALSAGHRFLRRFLRPLYD